MQIQHARAGNTDELWSRWQLDVQRLSLPRIEREKGRVCNKQKPLDTVKTRQRPPAQPCHLGAQGSSSAARATGQPLHSVPSQRQKLLHDPRSPSLTSINVFPSSFHHTFSKPALGVELLGPSALQDSEWGSCWLFLQVRSIFLALNWPLCLTSSFQLRDVWGSAVAANNIVSEVEVKAQL